MLKYICYICTYVTYTGSGNHQVLLISRQDAAHITVS